MKEQTTNTHIQINKKEIGKLPEKVFRIMIVKMIQNFENRMEIKQYSINTFNKYLDGIKNKQR